MNELLYKKIDNCIQQEMERVLDKITNKGADKTNPALMLIIIVLCACISSSIRDILNEDINDA